MHKQIKRFGLLFAYLNLSLVLLFQGYAQAEEKIAVHAAASLTNAMTEISADYEKGKSIKLQNSFAASSALAKQIENGAPADIFISANAQWMDYLQDKNLVDSTSRVDLLKNNLVLVVPKGKAFKVDFSNSFNLAKAFDGKLCTGEVESVPAGIYAKQALISLGWWDELKPRIVGAQDVRGALAFVERAECPLGIVYETDVQASERVEIIGIFPTSSHEPVIYPAALTNGASSQAKTFFQFLKSDAASRIFAKYGFAPIK